MHPFRPLLSFVLMAAVTSAGALGQVTTVSTQSIGPGCNVGSTGCCLNPPAPTTLTVFLDLNSRLEVDVNAIEGCCGVGVALRLLALGEQPAAVPLPDFGSQCMLRVAPMLLLATTDGCFLFDLPPTLPPLTVLAQAAAFITSTTPIAGPGVMTFTDGVAITLQ